MEGFVWIAQPGCAGNPTRHKQAHHAGEDRFRAIQQAGLGGAHFGLPVVSQREGHEGATEEQQCEEGGDFTGAHRLRDILRLTRQGEGQRPGGQCHGAEHDGA